MKTTASSRQTSDFSRNSSIIRVLAVTVAVLLVPLAAMQVNESVRWTPLDFVVAAALLLGIGFTFELAIRRISSVKRRLLFTTALGTLLLLIWVELAVGLFGSPFAGS